MDGRTDRHGAIGCYDSCAKLNMSSVSCHWLMNVVQYSCSSGGASALGSNCKPQQTGRPAGRRVQWACKCKMLWTYAGVDCCSSCCDMQHYYTEWRCQVLLIKGLNLVKASKVIPSLTGSAFWLNNISIRFFPSNTDIYSVVRWLVLIFCMN